MDYIIWLIISLGIILIGSELFVNGIEWTGKLLNLSEGAVGSVLAAVGTALPETLIPLVAILFNETEGSHEVSIGAILGAPLMLSTLAMFITGMAVLFFSYKRTSGRIIIADYETMRRDLSFFIIAYTIALVSGIKFLNSPNIKTASIVFLIVAYVFYLYKTLSEPVKQNNDHNMPQCYFRFFLKRQNLNWVVLLQVICALLIMIIGANSFVASINRVADFLKVPVFVLVLIITPIATELPEKFNSIIWISRGKDTLALGNITGAMVFQSSLIPALGIWLTDWTLTAGALISGFIALISATFLFIQLSIKKHFSAGMLISCGIFYLLFIGGVLCGFIGGL